MKLQEARDYLLDDNYGKTYDLMAIEHINDTVSITYVLTDENSLLMTKYDNEIVIDKKYIDANSSFDYLEFSKVFFDSASYAWGY